MNTFKIIWKITIDILAIITLLIGVYEGLINKQWDQGCFYLVLAWGRWIMKTCQCSGLIGCQKEYWDMMKYTL